MVTHDRDTLYALTDRVAVLGDRHIIACGTQEEVRELPHPFVQSFLRRTRPPCARARRGRRIRPMESRAYAFITGLFVVALVAAIVAWANWLAQEPEDRKAYRVIATTPVSGLNAQAQVRYRGMSVGRVTSIKLDPTGSPQDPDRYRGEQRHPGDARNVRAARHGRHHRDRLSAPA